MRIAVFAHDAGASDILLALAKRFFATHTFFFFAIESSPMHRRLDENNLPAIFVYDDANRIESTLKRYTFDLLLYGTSWQNTTELFFLDFARRHKIPSVAFLDHWSYYKERFSHRRYPDFIATHDRFSTQIARRAHLPNVVPITNYALLDLIQAYRNIQTAPCDTLLYLSEPTADVAKKRYGDPYYWGFDEIDIYAALLELSKRLHLRLIIRLHPSDTKERYLRYDPNAVFSNDSLLEDIASARLVAGIDTVALYYAYILGKPTFSLLPSAKRTPHVPLPKTNRFTRLTSFDISQLHIGSPDTANAESITFDRFLKEYL